MNLSLLFILLISFGCASNLKDFSNTHSISIDELDYSENAPLAKIDYDANYGLEKLLYKEKEQHRAEWLACIGKKDGVSFDKTVVVIGGSYTLEDKGELCGGWLAQQFLNIDFNILLINEPGLGASTGGRDFGGGLTLFAMKRVVNHFEEVFSKKKVIGVWAFDTGVVASSFYSKMNKNIQWLIFCNGIYDAEITSKDTMDSSLKVGLNELMKKVGEEAFEVRSIAWDTEGLAKRILIYHGGYDFVAPLSQAKAFYETLKAEEYNVQYIEIGKIGHYIPEKLHSPILRSALRKMNFK